MPKYAKKSPEEIAASGKAKLINAFVKTKKTTPPVKSSTSKDKADNN